MEELVVTRAKKYLGLPFDESFARMSTNHQRLRRDPKVFSEDRYYSVERKSGDLASFYGSSCDGSSSDSDYDLDLFEQGQFDKPIEEDSKCKDVSQSHPEEIKNELEEIKKDTLEIDKLYPASFFCPITFSLMVDPVIDPEGNTYERDPILKWLKEKGTSPITRKQMKPRDLISNRALRDAILHRTAKYNSITGKCDLDEKEQVLSIIDPKTEVFTSLENIQDPDEKVVMQKSINVRFVSLLGIKVTFVSDQDFFTRKTLLQKLFFELQKIVESDSKTFAALYNRNLKDLSVSSISFDTEKNTLDVILC